MKRNLEALACSFPTLRRKLEALPYPAVSGIFAPRDGAIGFTDDGAERFARMASAWSGGEQDAALFVLSVWNHYDSWADCGLSRSDGRFDVHTALGNWDSEHREAFLAWARDPWWM